MKLRFLNILPVLIVYCCTLPVHAQEAKREKLQSYFGIQIKPLIPGDFLSKSVITLSDGSFSGTYTQRPAYSFGAIIRIGLTKLISLETGINQVKRNYKIDFSLPDSNAFASTSLSILSYDIPLNLMMYVQMSERFFTNASLGTSLVYYPSNVAATVIADSKHLFAAEGRRLRFFDFEINGNLGLEYRSDKNGFFYLGVSGKIPYHPIYKVAASYEYSNSLKKLAVGNINGAYLSIDFRYFFPNMKTKGTTFKNGPITQ